MEEAGSLQYKCLCRDHFLPTDFMTPEGIRLNRLAVPLGLDSASHSVPQNCNLPVLPPLPLTSEFTPEENSLQVLPPLRTYSKLRSSSTHIETSLPIHIDSSSTSCPISVPNRTLCAWHYAHNSITCHFMKSTILQSHVWLEIKWHYFQLASVLFRFELQQLISAVVYI
jgi:hypothetical protein